MRFFALATDYDGTLAKDGRVTQASVAALEKLRGSGRKLILVTGRQLEELLGIFPEITLFDQVVFENGAALYQPGARTTRVLAEPPPAAFIDALRKRRVAPLAVGHVIVATWKPHETAVLEAIRDLGLELQVIFNKDAVMVLPAGVNKATGLAAALGELRLSPHEIVGVGDAENDHAFLSVCECAVAVKNALPTVKERADLITADDHGRGVENVILRLLDNDLQDADGRLQRHDLLLGRRAAGEQVKLPAYGSNLLIAGPSGSGKSMVSKSYLERLQEQHYQFCVIDPEGDYDGLEGAITIGSSKRGPTVDEILQFLMKPEINVAVNLVGMALADRPPFFQSLWPRLQELRSRLGRPHWIVIDEAHHLLPAAWAPGLEALPRQLDRMVFLTVHPEQVMTPVLAAVTTVIAVGPAPEQTLARYCRAIDEKPPSLEDGPRGQETGADSNDVVMWPRRKNAAAFRVTVVRARAEHRRHVRKYAEGELPPERSFCFRGPDNRLNLRAQNLNLFNQIAAGVDDATWLYHLKNGDYSRWFRDGIRDEVLADEAAAIEVQPEGDALQTRQQIKNLVEKYYTLPVSAAVPLPGTSAESKPAR